MELDADSDKTEEQYEHVNLQGFGDMLSNETIEEINWITSNNEQHNY